MPQFTVTCAKSNSGINVCKVWRLKQLNLTDMTSTASANEPVEYLKEVWQLLSMSNFTCAESNP